MAFNDDIIDAVWEKASAIQGFDKDKFRRDCCGAIIAKDKYGDIESSFGWQIDHVYPTSKGGTDELENLRAMQWQNNVSKSDDYPSYFSVMRSNGTSNEECKIQHTVNLVLQQKLEKLYGI